MEKYTVSDELNKRYSELEKKYGTEKLPTDVKEYFDYDVESLVEYISTLESEINFLTTIINRIEAKYKETENKWI